MKVKVEDIEEIQHILCPADVPEHFICAKHIRVSTCPAMMTPTQAQVHLVRAHNVVLPPNMRCKKCTWSFNNNLARYLAHQIMHVSTKKCTVCNKSFRCSEERLRHFCTSHGYSATTDLPPL
ncbi:hypothetical protein VTO73DRAFT_3371 [Trametes versicolor]